MGLIKYTLSKLRGKDFSMIILPIYDIHGTISSFEYYTIQETDCWTLGRKQLVLVNLQKRKSSSEFLCVIKCILHAAKIRRKRLDSAVHLWYAGNCFWLLNILERHKLTWHISTVSRELFWKKMVMLEVRRECSYKWVYHCALIFWVMLDGWILSLYWFATMCLLQVGNLHVYLQKNAC